MSFLAEIAVEACDTTAAGAIQRVQKSLRPLSENCKKLTAGRKPAHNRRGLRPD
jgi:hypothetical protein